MALFDLIGSSSGVRALIRRRTRGASRFIGFVSRRTDHSDRVMLFRTLAIVESVPGHRSRVKEKSNVIRSFSADHERPL
jgi:hypothetical protein